MIGESPTLLAIDTATEQAGVGVLADRRVTALSWHAGRNHTVMLMSSVHQAMTLAGIVPSELDGVVVSLGPGTFTGLRVGMATAKGFVLAAGLPLIGVPTLHAAALPWLGGDAEVTAVVQAGRGRLVWGTYAGDAMDPQEIAPACNGTPEELIAALGMRESAQVVTGEVDGTVALALLGLGVQVPAAPLRVRRPEALLTVGAARYAIGAFDDAALLEPFYLSR